MHLDITTRDYKTVKYLLNAYLPGTTVWAFGSRVKFTSKPESDLDLIAFIQPGQENSLADLKDAFAESDLPFKVDILDWNIIPDNFKRNIERDYVVLQDANAEKTQPSDWKIFELNELAELRKEQIIPNGKEQPYIGLEHIEQQTLRLNGIGSSRDVISNKFKFYAGDILYGKLRPYFRKVYHPNFDGVCSTDIYVVKNKKIINKDFLFYLIASEEFTGIANSGSSGTKMPRAEWNHLSKSVWPIPLKMETQKEISFVLSCLDEKIELNQQMNQTLESMAQAIFKEWFVNFNFPGFDGELVNELPKGWQIGTIYDLMDVTYGFPFMSNLFNEDEHGIGLIRIRNLKSNKPGLYTTEQAEDKYLVKPGDILAGMDAEFIPSIWLGEDAWLNQRVCKFKPNKEYVNELFILYSIKPLLERIQYGKVGTTVIHLGKADIDRFRIVIPDVKLLKIVNTVFATIHQKQIAVEKEVRILKDIRDNLLPRLMTGKIEIKD